MTWAGWTILGVGLTVVFGILAAHLTWRFRPRTEAEVRIVDELTTPLFSEVTKNLDELTVIYKGQPATESLVFLRLILVNVGSLDISHPMVEEPIGLDAPEGAKWLSAEITGASPGFKAEVSIASPRTIRLETGLWRRGEAVRLEAILEAPVGVGYTRAGDCVIASHRIRGTKEVQVVAAPQELSASHRRSSVSRLVLLLVGVPLGASMFVILDESAAVEYTAAYGVMLAVGVPVWLLNWRASARERELRWLVGLHGPRSKRK